MSNTKTPQGSISLEDKVRLFRKRFAGRDDVFYEKIPKEVTDRDPETGELIKKTVFTMMPQCSNYHDPQLCLLKRGGRCGECKNRINEAVSDSWVKRHILGQNIICPIPIAPDGAKFGVMDFDESFEDGLEFVFADAKKTKDFCESIGLKTYIARSSNKGYHLYFFLKEWNRANKITSILTWLLRELGFTARQQSHGVRLPEIFPKQVRFNPESFGNGVRVPMSEPDMRQGRNCFVDDNRDPYHIDKQWELLLAVEEITTEQIDKVIADNKIEVYEDGFGKYNRKRETIKKKVKITRDDGKVEEVELEEPAPERNITKVGSFWNVVAACPAMQEYWAKGPDGKYLWDKSNAKGLFHTARYASMTLALSTQDGEGIILDRWSSSKTTGMVEGAKSHGYCPVTCKWMQQAGVCRVGKHPKYESYCYKKLPSYYKEEGKNIELPEEEWSEVSPIRYCTENRLTVDDIKERFALISRGKKLQKDIDSGAVKVDIDERKRPVISQEAYTPEKAAEMIAGLFRRMATMKEAQRDEVFSYVIANKWMTKTEWNSKMKAAGAFLNESRKKKAASQFKSFAHKGRTYSLQEGKISTIFTDAKGGLHEETFSNFWIERNSEPAKIKLRRKLNDTEEVEYENRTYTLTIHVGNQERLMTIGNKEFSNAHTFFERLRVAGGTELIMTTSKDAYDIIMNSITVFSDQIEERYAFDEIGYYQLKQGTKYVMPSVIIDKDSIEKNTAYEVQMENEYTKCLDFSLIDTSTFSKLCTHIINDLFRANTTEAVMCCFAHAMASVCTYSLEEAGIYKKAPALWWWGGFAGGKTWIMEIMQYFFGDFSKAPTMASTGSFKAKIGVAHHFRHVLAVFDDNKASLATDGGRGMKQFVQNAYDKSIMPALNREGALRASPLRVRGLVAVSSEDPIDKEASAISRLILLNHDPVMNTEKGDKVSEMKALYAGFTPYVIKHVLNIRPDMLKEMWRSFFSQIYAGSEKEDNSVHRLSENLTLNYLGMQVALDAMVANGGITIEKAREISAKHLTSLRNIKASMLDAVVEAKGSHVFLEELRQLLADPVKYKILGWGPTETDASMRAQALGFIRPKNPGIVYIYTELAYQAVSKAMREKNSTPQSKNHIGQQLLAEGLIERDLCQKGRSRARVKDPNNMEQQVYPMRVEVLGLVDAKQAPKALDSRPKMPVNQDEDEILFN